MVTEKRDWNNSNLLLLNYSFVQLPSACLWFCWKVLSILAKGLFKRTWICGLSLSRFKSLSEAREMAQWAECLPYRHEDLSPQKPCKKSGSGIPVTPALGRVKNAPLCVCISRNTHAHKHAQTCYRRSIRKLTSDAQPPDTTSFFPRLTAHREIILATRPWQNRALYVMEKSSCEPGQISSSKDRLVEIHLIPLSHPAGFYILPRSSHLLPSFSPVSVSFSFTENRTFLTQRPRAQGTWLPFHRKNLVFMQLPRRNLVLLYSLASWQYLYPSDFVLLICLHWPCVS